MSHSERFSLTLDCQLWEQILVLTRNKQPGAQKVTRTVVNTQSKYPRHNMIRTKKVDRRIGKTSYTFGNAYP